MTREDSSKIKKSARLGLVSNGLLIHLINFTRGLSLGIVELVPGVSAGTLALILGIYEQSILAVSSIFDVIRALVTFPSRKSSPIDLPKLPE